MKLQSNKEQLLLVRKQLDHSEENCASLEKRSKDLVTQLDASRSQCSLLAQERETLQKSLDALKADKYQLEKQRLEINSIVESLQQDYEKLQKTNYRLEKELDTVHEEKIFLQSEVDRLNQDADLREIALRGEEDRCSRMREELLTVREELNKLYLAHDVLEAQKLEADNLIYTLEKTKADYELQMEKVLGERTDVHDSLVKKETLASNLEMDKKKLLDNIKKVSNCLKCRL